MELLLLAESPGACTSGDVESPWSLVDDAGLISEDAGACSHPVLPLPELLVTVARICMVVIWCCYCCWRQDLQSNSSADIPGILLLFVGTRNRRKKIKWFIISCHLIFRSVSQWQNLVGNQLSRSVRNVVYGLLAP